MRDLVTKRILLFGICTWLIPFLVSIPLVRPNGETIIAEAFFKSLMLLVGSGVGVGLLVAALNGSSGRTHAFRICLVWLGINWGLDLLVLLPLSGMSFIEYATQIGIGYLSIPIVGAGMDASRAMLTRQNSSDISSLPASEC